VPLQKNGNEQPVISAEVEKDERQEQHSTICKYNTVRPTTTININDNNINGVDGVGIIIINILIVFAAVIEIMLIDTVWCRHNSVSLMSCI